MRILKNTRMKLFINILLYMVIALAIIFNIVLLRTDVYNGAYSATLPNGERAIVTFYDNTYTYIEQNNGRYETYNVGFFKYFYASKFEQSSTQENEILLILSSDDNYFSKYMYFKRNSVFCISKQFNNKDGNQIVSYYCSTAIFLQVLYALLVILAIIILVLFNRKFKQTKTSEENVEDGNTEFIR